MRGRKIIWSLAVTLLLVFVGKFALAEGFGLGETKEQLKLDYEVKAKLFANEHVTVEFWLVDEGRLAPIYDVELLVPHKSGSGTAEFAASLAMKPINGKKYTAFQMPKALADRAEIHLRTGHLDGKTERATFYFHTIRVKDYIVAEKK